MKGYRQLKSTIVIPNYNGIKYIESCLDSLLGYEPYIIVVDNGSTDGSLEILKKYPQIQVIELGENTGFCKACNVGIEKAETDYVVLLNNDLTVEKGFVEALEEAMDTYPKAFSVNAQMRSMQDPSRMDNAGNYYCALGWAFDYGKGKKAGIKYEIPRKIFASCAGAAIYRKSILEEIGYFDENHFAYLEDMDLGYRARIYGYENYYEPKALVYHAGSATSGSKYNAFKTNLSSRNSIYLIGKNMPLLQILLNLPFFIIGFGVKWLFFCKKGMGGLYLKGLGKGVQMCFSKEGKKHRVPFRFGHLWNYIKIQWQLWVGILIRFLA